MSDTSRHARTGYSRLEAMTPVSAAAELELLADGAGFTAAFHPAGS